MFNYNRSSAEELHPMELAFIGKESVNLDAVAAEYTKLIEDGYIELSEEEHTYVLKKPLPMVYPAYDHVLLNGLFYKTEKIAVGNIPIITAHAVLESLRYLEFETAKIKGARERKIYDYAKKILDTENLYGILALGELEKYRKVSLYIDSDEEDFIECLFDEFSIVKSSLGNVLTPELSIIGKAAIGGVGRAFIGGTGASITESAKDGCEIDWNYLLSGQIERTAALANVSDK